MPSQKNPRNGSLSSQLREFADQFCNWAGLSSFCISVDQDWAPDYMTTYLLKILEQHGVRATIFATGPSKLLEQIDRNGIHEIGTHINLAPQSTQGKTIFDTIENLKRPYPNVLGNRFHLLSHSYGDLAILGSRGFSYDSSCFRHACPYLLPSWHPDIGMTLIPYFWEDGMTIDDKYASQIDSFFFDLPGLKVFNFHPVNVFLNLKTAAQRDAFKKAHPNLTKCAESDALEHRSELAGVETALKKLLTLTTAKNMRCVLLRDVDAAFRATTAATCQRSSS